MSRFITLFFLLSLFSRSNGQEFGKSNIIGNWYNYENTVKTKETVMYTETLFSFNKYYFYQNILSLPSEYFVKEDRMYLVGELIKDTLIIEKPIFLDKNTLKIAVKKPEYIILKRVIDINTLEDFVNQKIDEKTYYPSFLKRKEYWEKYGKLPENGDFNNPPKCKEW